MIVEKESLSEKQKNFFKNREEIAEKITALDKEVYRLSNQKERHEESIKGQIEYMWNEYEMTLRDAEGLKDETMTDLVFIKRSIAEIKDSIKRLGDVNVNAIEDYRNL